MKTLLSWGSGNDINLTIKVFDGNRSRSDKWEMRMLSAFGERACRMRRALAFLHLPPRNWSPFHRSRTLPSQMVMSSIRNGWHSAFTSQHIFVMKNSWDEDFSEYFGFEMQKGQGVAATIRTMLWFTQMRSWFSGLFVAMVVTRGEEIAWLAL